MSRALKRALQRARENRRELLLKDPIGRKDAIAIMKRLGWTGIQHGGSWVEGDYGSRDNVACRVWISGGRVTKIGLALTWPVTPVHYSRFFKSLPTGQQAVRIMK